MIHLIYIYLIICALQIGYEVGSTYNENMFKRTLFIVFVSWTFPFYFLCSLLVKLYKNDYVFFIRILINKRIVKSNDSLLYHIRMRRNLRGKIWNYLADKVVIKIK